MDDKILEIALCKEVIRFNGDTTEVECEGVWCHSCPLSRQNSGSDFECSNSKQYADNIKIAKEYIVKYSHEETPLLTLQEALDEK